MSRVLKRPMFRKGGPAMEGVMTGIEDRTNFANGTTQKMIEERAKLLQAAVGQPSRGAALTNFLLQFGPAIASRPTTGNIFADIAGAAQAPAADLAKQIGAEDAFKRQLGLSAASGILSEQAAERLAEIKAKSKRQFRSRRNPGETREDFYLGQVKTLTGDEGPYRGNSPAGNAVAKFNTDIAFDTISLTTKDGKAVKLDRDNFSKTQPVLDVGDVIVKESGKIELNPDSGINIADLRIGDYHFDLQGNRYLRWNGKIFEPLGG